MDGKGSERFDTVVVGAGQAGLSAGYYLKQAGRSFLILGPKCTRSLRPVTPRSACAVTSASRSAPVGAPIWSSITRKVSRSAASLSMVFAKFAPRAPYTQLVRRIRCRHPLARMCSSPSSFVFP